MISSPPTIQAEGIFVHEEGQREHWINPNRYPITIEMLTLTRSRRVIRSKHPINQVCTDRGRTNHIKRACSPGTRRDWKQHWELSPLDHRERSPRHQQQHQTQPKKPRSTPTSRPFTACHLTSPPYYPSFGVTTAENPPQYERKRERASEGILYPEESASSTVELSPPVTTNK